MSCHTVPATKEIFSIRTLLTTVVGPLTVVTILGYIALFNTTNRLVLLAELQEKRATAIEQEVRAQDRGNREIQLMVAKHSQIIDHIFKELTILGKGR